jgi:hypothetical protein
VEAHARSAGQARRFGDLLQRADLVVGVLDARD